jgi:hypothetical protein
MEEREISTRTIDRRTGSRGEEDGMRGPDGGNAGLGEAEQSQEYETEKRKNDTVWKRIQLFRPRPLFEDHRGESEKRRERKSPGELGRTKADKEE